MDRPIHHHHHQRRRPRRYKHTVGETHRSYAATLNNLGLVFLAQVQQAEAQGKGRMQTMGYLDRWGLFACFDNDILIPRTLIIWRS